MLNLTRKVPKRGKGHNSYGDRNKVVIRLESGEVIELCLKDLKGNELKIGITGPNSMQVDRKERLTGDRGVEYEKRKVERERKIWKEEIPCD